MIINNTNGLNMYIDQVIYTPTDVEPERFAVTIRQSDHGYVVADVDSTTEGATVKLTATIDDGYTLSGWNVLHGGVTISEDGTFIMPDDNVTIQPIFSDESAVYALDFGSVLGGNMPEGWRAVQEDNAVHEYPNSYSSGARTFTGFTGYQGKALYWRINNCEYGRQNGYRLPLELGKYKLSFATAAWKEKPSYKVRILDESGNVIASSETLTATPNANGNTAANLTSAALHELNFEIIQPT